MNGPGGPVSCGIERLQGQEVDSGQGVTVVAECLWRHAGGECE